MIQVPLPIHLRRLTVILPVEKPRRLIGFHLKTFENTKTNSGTTFYVQRVEINDAAIPIALLSVARKNPSGFEILLGRASGVPSSFAPDFEISERGIDLPAGESISLWSTHLTGDAEIELLWC